MANRMMTPDNNGTDYAYVNYHDTANSRASQARDPDVNLAPTRGILKNKQVSVNFLKINKILVLGI